MKAYVTKWWETRGILEVEGEVVQGQNATYFKSGTGITQMFVFVRIGTDAFGTRAEAVAKVKKAALTKAAALEAKVVELKRIAMKGL